MGLLLSHDVEKEVSPRSGTTYSLEELQGYVEGYIEVVYLNDGRLMIVDEEGWLKDNYLNGKASRIAGRMIAGNALIIKRDEIE